MDGDAGVGLVVGVEGGEEEVDAVVLGAGDEAGGD